MPRVTTVLLSATLAGAALYGGTKVYLHYQANELFKEVSNKALIVGQLSYGGITTSLSGSLTYNNIRLATRGAPSALTIDAITFDAPNVIYLIGALSGAESQGEMPKELRLSITGLTLDLDSALARQMDEQIVANWPEQSPDTLLCDGEVMGPAQYRLLGYKQLKVDMAFGYQLSGSSLVFNVDGALRDVGKVSTSVTFKDVHSLETQQMLGISPNAVQKIEFIYEDGGMTQRTNEYCAAFNGLSTSEYIRDADKRSDEFYLNHLGFVPGPGLRSAYHELIANPGKLRVVARVPEAFNFGEIGRYSPAMLPSLLDMMVEVNGKLVDDLTITAIAAPTPAPKVAATPAPQPAPFPEGWRNAGREERRNAKTEEERDTLSGYRNISPAELGKYIDKRVRLTLKSGAVREGVLAEVAAGHVQIEQFLYPQTVSMRVKREDIAQAELSTSKRGR